MLKKLLFVLTLVAGFMSVTFLPVMAQEPSTQVGVVLEVGPKVSVNKVPLAVISETIDSNVITGSNQIFAIPQRFVEVGGGESFTQTVKTSFTFTGSSVIFLDCDGNLLFGTLVNIVGTNGLKAYTLTLVTTSTLAIHINNTTYLYFRTPNIYQYDTIDRWNPEFVHVTLGTLSGLVRTQPLTPEACGQSSYQWGYGDWQPGCPKPKAMWPKGGNVYQHDRTEFFDVQGQRWN